MPVRNELLYPTATIQYLDQRQSRLRGRDTRKGVQSVLSRLQTAHPGQRTNEFTEAQLVAWLNNPAWAPASVARYRSVLVQFFRWAARQGLVEVDPAAWLAELVAPPSRGVRSPTWLEDHEIHQLLSLCGADDVGLRDRVALALPIYTGLRVAEFSAPPLGRPDRGLSWGRVRRDAIKVFGKGEKWETVGLAPQLATILGEWRARYESAIDRPVGLHDPVLVRAWECTPTADFCAGQVRTQALFWGKGLGPAGVRDLVHAYGSRLGYPELAPHDLRRTFAYALKRAGVPIEDISKMMRHENIATTVRYLKHDKSALAGHWAKVAAGA